MQVWWGREGGELLVPGQSHRVRQIVHHRSHYLLRIKGVREADFGKYFCGLNATNARGRREVHKEMITLSGMLINGTKTGKSL